MPHLNLEGVRAPFSSPSLHLCRTPAPPKSTLYDAISDRSLAAPTKWLCFANPASDRRLGAQICTKLPELSPAPTRPNGFDLQNLPIPLCPPRTTMHKITGPVTSPHRAQMGSICKMPPSPARPTPSTDSRSATRLSSAYSATPHSALGQSEVLTLVSPHPWCRMSPGLCAKSAPRSTSTCPSPIPPCLTFAQKIQ